MVFTHRSFSALTGQLSRSSADGRRHGRPFLKHRSLHAFLLVGACSLSAAAQTPTPVIMPNTITTIAGATPVTSTANTVCPTNANFTAQNTTEATGTSGDGCPAVNATLSGNEKAITVDPQGNVYFIADTSNPQAVRKIDARTHNISAFAGNASSTCATAVTVDGGTYAEVDKVGDGCPVAYSNGFNGARGLGSDPYGNIFIGVTGDNVLHLVCMAVSPLCTAAQVRVNLMSVLAGCTYSNSQYGVAVLGTTQGTAGDGGVAALNTTSSANCTRGVDAPRMSVGDKWDNVYFMDGLNGRLRVVAGAASITVNGSTITNPLYAVLATDSYTAVQGNIYPIAGGGTACSGKTDTYGDGCPFYQTVVNTSSSGAVVQGLVVDNEGDFIFDDGEGDLRVIYEGGTVIRGALATNGISSPQLGYSYRLIGGGTTYYYNSGNPGIIKGTSDALQATYQTLATDPAGNVYIADQTQLLFYDISTGYVRRISTSSGATSCNTSTVGDGCPITQALFGVANASTPIAMDVQGNLYILDAASTSGNKRIRMVTATNLPSTPVTTTQTSKLTTHSPIAGSTVTISAPSTPDFSIGSPTCTTNSSADNSVDCTALVTYVPSTLEQRAYPVQVATTSTGTTNQFLGLNAQSTGSALAFDVSGSPSTTTLGATTTGNTAVVLDGAGNQYVVGVQGISRITSGTATNITSAPATYIAVDASGDVYSNTGKTATSINKYTYSPATGTYTASLIGIPTIPINGTLTQGYGGPFVVDSYGIIYIADLNNLQVIKFSQTSGVGQQVTQTALTAPVALSQDSYGQLLVLDGTTLYRIPSAGFATNATSPVANPKLTFSTALVAPTSVSADQGENLYIADSGSVIVLSQAGYEYTIPNVSATSIAVDGSGNLYTVSSSVAGVTKVQRSAESANFGTNVSTPYVGVFLNSGATAATGFSQTDTGGNYSALAPTSPLATGAATCNLASTALAGGGICNTALYFSPTSSGTGDTPDVITLVPATNTYTLGALSLDGTKNGSTATTTTAVTGNTSGLVYTSGVETTFTVTVTQSTGTPAGNVSVSIDGGSAVTYPLTTATSSTATASVPVSGLTATVVSNTPHTIVATYAGSSGIAGSTSSTTSFSIAQATTSVSWTPGATTQLYSAAIGTSVLNATASIPGVFVYLATPSGGSPVEVHSASYLAIGTYSIGVTFTPTDSTDYTGSTGSLASYTVTKAATTAAVGASQFLVASDGSGNYTSVQSAINALGANGGSVYIAPGTYTGDITVVQPNVALRGLGGDPTKVILTHESGSFSVNPGSVYNYTGEFTTAYSNGYQLPSGSSLFSGDQGSATLVVAKGVNTAFSTATLTPNNFYGENFTLINNYDSDTTTTTTTYVSGNVCTANAGTAMTYNALFNAGIQCASQALAIWITSDLAVMYNVYTTSLQDTIYAGSQGSGSNGYVPSREYWFRGKVTGTVDYIFGDAAAVFDHSSIYTVPHGTGVSGTATIEAQNKAVQSGSASDYLSGYIMNSNVFTSYTTGMSGLYFGRPYGTYSTWVMLNSAVDQVANVGYIEFSGDTNLPTSTYAEYNNSTYTDPANGSPDANGVTYLGLGGNSGSGAIVNGTTVVRETTSTNPGTTEVSRAGFQTTFPALANTTLSQIEAQQYYPTNFLGKTVSSAISSTTNWNPTAALATNVNAFVPSNSSLSITQGTSVTILIRPQTPGLGAVAFGSYTIPTGTYTLYDGANVLATGTLDASGEAHYTSSNLAAGTHSLTWTYSGDSNFYGSTTSTAYILTVTGSAASTTTVVSPGTASYGNSDLMTATVLSAGSAVTSGTVTITVDGTSTSGAIALNGSGQATYSFSGLTAGSHSVLATYSGTSSYGTSTSSTATASVGQATLTITGACSNRVYGAANACTTPAISGYKYTDSVSTVFTATPTSTTTATRNSPAASYSAVPSYTLSTFGSTNYTVSAGNGSFTVTGGAPQSIIFATLPNFPHGTSYQLTARTTSGLPVAYTVTVGGSIASVSGTTLTVTGTGAITVQASTAADPTGDYAIATPVSQSFTAQ